MTLAAADFAEFFGAVHGSAPFPWQQALVQRLADSDTWPDVLDLPTGSGKTAALDAAVFHLALRADAPRKAALRIALVVDRRLVVDDAFTRARRIQEALCRASRSAGGSAVVAEVAQRLQRLAGESGPPLAARRLRGGAPLEDDWARTPTQPTILCSTVDQVGSRLLFRGYGVSDRMKPVHAGLLGVGSLILLDEAHLAEPFRQALDAVRTIGRAEIKVALLSATAGKGSGRPFALSRADRAAPELRQRLKARKPVALKPTVRGAAPTAPEVFAVEARAIAHRLRARGVSPPAVGVVVNRIALARDIFEELQGDDTAEVVLMIGRSRAVDRDAVAHALAPFRTGARNRAEAKPLFVVATQCLEVGVDVDLDGLVTQAASLDALRQRFGRLNRAGRRIDAEGAIVALSDDIAKRADDPVYGDRIRRTWDALAAIAEDGAVDFGVEALPKRLKEAELDPDDFASERPDAPVVLPAYLDLWSQTSPRPASDPEVGLFLHGAERTAAGVSIIWRGDISEADLAGKTGVDLTELLRLIPPRAAEALELPLWVARAWLRGSGEAHADASDMPEREPGIRSGVQARAMARQALRWAGHNDPGTRVVTANELRTGDVLVVPAGYGGCDSFGWAPKFNAPVVDVADAAARPYWGRRCAVRITPAIVGSNEAWARILEVLASEPVNGIELLDHVLGALSSEETEDRAEDGSAWGDVRVSLDTLRRANESIDIHFPYAGGSDGGVVLVARHGIAALSDAYLAVPATEDDATSNTSNTPVDLDDHGRRVARFTQVFGRTLGLHDVADDLHCAAYLHDAGKADPRFQTMLAGGGRWNRPDGRPLAKSGRAWSPQAWAHAELPKGWRHEALSVRMARAHPALAAARDPALVLWLIGSHHGMGRPLFDFLDSSPERPQPCLDVADWRLPDAQLGPQSPAFDFAGFDWPSLFDDLKRRYGIWGLAHLEAILRLADHRASEEESAL